MPIKENTEGFIQKSKKVHGDFYDYSNVTYIKNSLRVSIICPIHGEFQQRANCHKNGKGCKQCGVEERAKKKTLSKETIISRFKKMYGNKYTYDLSKYKNTSSKIDIICPTHSVFTKTVSKHLQGQGCPNCSLDNHSGTFKNSNTQEFIEKAKGIHGDKYDYSKVKYKAAIENIEIICKKHGSFYQTPHTHLNGCGCNECGEEKTANIKRKPLSKFIYQANIIHNYKYIYDKVIYKNDKTKIKIGCPIHGLFNQTPNSHLNGNGCPNCGFENTRKYMQENPTGWSYSNWERQGLISKYFDSFKVYIIKCWNDKEEFYKIGKTFKTVENRFNKTYNPYNYEILYEKKGESKCISNLENKLKKENKTYKYLPSINFNGMYECYTTDLPIEEVKEYISKTLTSP